MDFLNECSQNLDKAIDFINSSSHEDNDTRLYYIDLLDKQIMKLDTIEDRNNRKLYILATQNILSQLESLYKKEKQIDNKSSRSTYLPEYRNTHYPYVDSYDQGLLY